MRVRPLHILVFGALAAALPLFGFLSLGSEVREGDTQPFDLVVLHMAQRLRENRPWVVEVMRDLSGVGSTVVLTLVTVATVLYLALFMAARFAVLVAISVISGPLLMTLLKGIFGRVRPDAAHAEMVVTGLSFPSGHATMSAIVFLTLGVLLASISKTWPQRVLISGVAATMTMLVGISRLALGVHWATDVAAGWAFGSAWALLWLLLAAWLPRR